MNRRLTAFLIVVPLVLVAAAVARASQVSGAARVTCVDGNHQVRVSGSYYEAINGEYDHIELERSSVGVCEPAEFLVDSPLPWAPVDEGGYHSFAATVTVTPPRVDLVYRYTPWLVRSDGSRSVMSHWCDMDPRSYGLSGCGTAPFMRGRVELDWSCWGAPCFRIVACPEDCWSEIYWELFTVAELLDLSGRTFGELYGQVVDVFGDRTYCGMLGDPSYQVTRVELTAGGACGSVPARTEPWGTVKARYR